MYKTDRDEEFSRIRDWLLPWKNKSSKDQLKLALEAFIECIDLTDEIRQYKGDINEVYRVWKLNCWDCESQVVTCSWCGNTGILGGSIDSINITGNF